MDFPDHRTQAAALYNSCWTIIEQAERTEDDLITLITNAFASRYHWLEAGGPEQWAIADWMVARAAGVTGDLDLALQFAERAHAAALAPSMPDWLVASAAEGLARVYALRGETALRNTWCQTAERLVAAIHDDEERSIIAEQLAELLG
jgi:transcriptional regulator GlxA family with amidase domain